MKSLLISIKPKFCAKIMNGNKTIEVRKNKALATAIQKLIDENGYADIYVYCSKEGKVPLVYNKILQKCTYGGNYGSIKDVFNELNGKVVFKFRCYKVEEYVNGCKLDGDYSDYEHILKPSCLTEEELDNYCEDLSFYAIHISDLEIFDKPKELSEFKRCTEKICIFSECHKYMHCLKPLTKAPQNICYVEEI